MNGTKLVGFILVATFLWSQSLYAKEEERIPIKVVDIHFSGDPVDYTASVGESLEDLMRAINTRGSISEIRQSLNLSYTNKTKNRIVAIEQGTIYYSIFDKHLRTAGNIWIGNLDAGAKSELLTRKMDFWGSWQVLTVVTFLRRVRFEDGRIWERDPSQIATEMAKRAHALFKKKHLQRTDIPKNAPRD